MQHLDKIHFNSLESDFNNPETPTSPHSRQFKKNIQNIDKQKLHLSLNKCRWTRCHRRWVPATDRIGCGSRPRPAL